MAGTPAKTILTKSLKEIEDGNWKRGTWGVGIKNGKCNVMYGCAMGMVSIYGGHFESVSQKYDEQTGQLLHSRDLPGNMTYIQPCIPNSAAPSGVQKAVRALFDSLPKSFRRESLDNYGYDPDGTSADVPLETQVNVCVEYNDIDSTGKGRAASWFRKALETLPAIK